MSDQPFVDLDDEEAIDPTNNLADQLVVATALISHPDSGDELDGEKFRHDARRLAQLVIQLSEWIEGGGDLPVQWRSDSGDGIEATVGDF